MCFMITFSPQCKLALQGAGAAKHFSSQGNVLHQGAPLLAGFLKVQSDLPGVGKQWCDLGPEKSALADTTLNKSTLTNPDAGGCLHGQGALGEGHIGNCAWALGEATPVPKVPEGRKGNCWPEFWSTARKARPLWCLPSRTPSSVIIPGKTLSQFPGHWMSGCGDG